MIDSLEVVRRGKVRRAKLYYLRERRGKKARIGEKQDFTTEIGEAAEAGRAPKTAPAAAPAEAKAE